MTVLQLRGRRRGAGNEAKSQSIVDVEDVGQRSALDELSPRETGIEKNRPGPDSQPIFRKGERADDHLRGAHHLADPDDGGLTEAR